MHRKHSKSTARRVSIVRYKHGQEPIRLHKLSSVFKECSIDTPPPTLYDDFKNVNNHNTYTNYSIVLFKKKLITETRKSHLYERAITLFHLCNTNQPNTLSHPKNDQDVRQLSYHLNKAGQNAQFPLECGIKFGQKCEFFTNFTIFL